jgi:hypothetical protein
MAPYKGMIKKQVNESDKNCWKVKSLMLGMWKTPCPPEGGTLWVVRELKEPLRNCYVLSI